VNHGNRYVRIIERIFEEKYSEGTTEIEFERTELTRVAEELKIELPKNLGDVIYSFRYRSALPDSVQSTAPEGQSWIIAPAGIGKYRFRLVRQDKFQPRSDHATIKVPDATPGIIEMYLGKDEQALLAKVRYNRLIDVFTGVTCYSLQNHLRTTVDQIGQIETDEVYVGVDKEGAHYVFPVQAKAAGDALGIVQIEQDIAMCKDKYPALVCRAIGAQFMEDNLIALLEFTQEEGNVRVAAEKHYRLVPRESLSDAELKTYRTRAR